VIRRWCGSPIAIGFGCAKRFPSGDVCRIALVDDEVIVAMGANPEIVLRHEIGHCNDGAVTTKAPGQHRDLLAVSPSGVRDLITPP
jgi:hypothetical protein